MKIIVFDLGGTLMQYVGMPYSWVDFYCQGFEAINKKYNCNISEDAIQEAVHVLKHFNPRVNYREIEYSAEFIFSKALEHWHIEIPIQNCIETFWNGLNLRVEIYSDTVDVLSKLKEKGYVISTLTDLPSAMPDEVFKRAISGIQNYFDCYISSAVSGYRKPNVKGLQMISEKYEVPITDIIFVGDEEKDRQTAISANCKFIHIDRTTENGESIRDLYELLELL